jgi:hypothetical protein
MNLTVHIPDDVAERLGADAAALERRALEALVAEEYRAGRLTRPDLRQLLGFQTSHEIDGFLKAHDIDDGITLEDLSRQLDDLDRHKDLNRHGVADDLVARFRAFAAEHTLGGLDIKDLISEGRR